MAAERIVVRQIGAPHAGAASGHVVRKQSREPQAVVAEVRLQQEAPLPRPVLLGEVRDDVHEIVVGLVVSAADPAVAAVIPELEQQRGEVVRERAVVHAAGEQRVPHSSIGEERC